MKRNMAVEELKVYVEILKVVSAFVIAVGGGTTALLLNMKTGLEAILFLLGALVEFGFITAFISIVLRISYLLRRAQDESNGTV